MFRVNDALDDMLPGMGLKWDSYPGTVGLGVVRVPATHACYFCSAQSIEMFNPLSERQQAFTGGAPVQVCAGCLDEAMSLK
jgi:hypothetical protein